MSKLIGDKKVGDVIPGGTSYFFENFVLCFRKQSNRSKISGGIKIIFAGLINYPDLTMAFSFFIRYILIKLS